MRICTGIRENRWGALLAGLAIIMSPAVTGQARAASVAASETLLQQMGLNSATVQTLSLPLSKTPGEFTVAVELGGTDVIVNLTPWSIRAGDFRLLERGAGGTVTEITIPAPTTYRGEVSGVPGSRVAASLRDDGLWAWIETPQQRWLVQPVTDSEHVVYRQEDVTPSPMTCAPSPPVPVPDQSSLSAPESSHTQDRRPEPTPTELALAASGISTIEMAIDTDWALYLYHGSSAAAVLADVETIANAMNLIYESQFQLSHILTAVVMRTTEEEDLGWSWPEFKLDKLREDWLLHHADIRRDLVHHFCEKDIDGPTVGIAYNGPICIDTSYSFGLSQTHFSNDFAQRVALTTHEIGHNWSATHCDGDNDCQIMCSAIQNCSTVIDAFGASAVAEISAHKSAAGCLSAAYSSVVYVDDTVPFPGAGTFSDPFATVDLGVQNSLDGGFLFLRAGYYTETVVIGRRLIVKTGQGPAVIGP